jgi:tetratricopeptide (TPR) repeat protein
MPGSIFISYRREDSKADARSIYQALERTFGANQLFMDVDTIEKGRDFRKALDETLARCQVMLAIVGPNWLDARDEAGARRLEHAGDYVHQEIAVALKRNIPVVPVLVNGAKLPGEAQLPASLKGLAMRQAAIVTHENFQSDMAGLERDIRALITSPRSSWPRIAAIALVLILAATAGGSYLFWPAPGPTSRSDPTPSPSPPAAPTAKTIDECDRRAAARYDREAVAPGVPAAQLATVAKRAVSACEDAVRDHPKVRRFAYQLARALEAAGQFDKARAGYETLVKQGYAAALYSLAMLYANGRGVPRDIGEANDLLRRAVEAGHAEAMFQLGHHVQFGLGFNAGDHVGAVALYRKAVNAGHVVTLIRLAEFQYLGFGGLARDPAEASRLYFKALATGDDEAHYMFHQFGLGNMGGADFVRELQTRLKEAGVYTAEIDGKMGPALVKAIVALKAKAAK